MYGSEDPRSKLKSGGGGGQQLHFVAAEYVKFHGIAPKEASPTGVTAGTP